MLKIQSVIKARNFYVRSYCFRLEDSFFTVFPKKNREATKNEH